MLEKKVIETLFLIRELREPKSDSEKFKDSIELEEKEPFLSAYAEKGSPTYVPPSAPFIKRDPRLLF